MINLQIKFYVDNDSFLHLMNSLSKEQKDKITADDIIWNVGNSYIHNNEICIPVYAVNVKFKNQSSCVELQGLLKQQPLKYLSDLCVEQFHMGSCCCQPLEIQPAPFPNGTPLLHKE